MRSFKQLENKTQPAVVTIGNFDGFHLGHRRLIEKVIDLAKNEALEPVAVTFFPHPREVIQPGFKLPRLMTLQDQDEGFAKSGFHTLYRLPFDQELRRTPADVFLKKLLENTSVRHLVVGHDFTLGADRAGDSEFLRSWCHAHQVHLHQMESVEVHGKPVSSQRIREHLQRGEVFEATVCLGRPFAVQAEVIAGDARGRQLGFPTANLSFPEDLIRPRFGVYAGHVDLGNHRLTGVANFGLRPTFDGQSPRCEVHLLDFTGDLYGRDLRFEFEHFLRAEKKFSDVEELKSQIAVDVKMAREILSGGSGQ